MENANHFGYFAKDVASELEITTSTLRRWSIELEKAGYSFERNEKEQRICQLTPVTVCQGQVALQHGQEGRHHRVVGHDSSPISARSRNCTLHPPMSTG